MMQNRPARPLSGREQFNNLSQEVAANGDLLDRLPLLDRYSTVGAISLTAVGVTSSQIGLARYLAQSSEYDLETFSGVPLSISLPGLSFAFLASYIRGHMHQKSRTADFRAKVDELRQTFDGDSVEIYQSYRKSGPRQHVAWEPSPTTSDCPEDIAASLSKLLDVTTDADISTFALDKNAIQSAGVDVSDLRSISRNDWLSRTKKKAPKEVRRQADDLLVLSRKELERVASQIETPALSALEAYMGVIRDIKFTHPSLKHMRKNAKPTKALERSLRATIELRLQDVHAKLVESNGRTVREKQHTQASISLDKRGTPRVKWLTFEHGPTGDRARLDRHLGITFEELSRLPADYKKMPKSRALQLAEVGAWLVAKDIIDENDVAALTRVTTLQSAKQSQILGRGTQERTYARSMGDYYPGIDTMGGMSLAPYRRKRLSKAICLLGLAAAIGGGGVYHAGKAKEAYEKKHIEPIEQATYLEQENYPPESPEYKRLKKDQDKQIAAKKRTLEWHVPNTVFSTAFAFNQVFGNVEEKYLENNEYLDSDYDQLAKEEYENQQVSTVGNAGNTKSDKSRPVWYINAMNGMSSEGLWAHDMSTRLADDPVEWIASEQVASEYPAGKVATLALEPDAQDRKQPMLHVKRLMSFNKTEPDGSTYQAYPLVGDGIEISVPVLENTEVAAASFDDTFPLKRYKTRNGITTLVLEDDGSKDSPDNLGELEYWLTPAQNKVRATESTDIVTYERNPTATYWQQRIPKLAQKNSSKRIAQQVSYIRSNFQYRLSPFPEPQPTDRLSKFVETTFEGKKANCNVANTLLVASNPDKLNYVTGFSNTNTPQQNKDALATLSSSEGHAWAVDKKGKVWDATPHKGMTEADKKYFEEDEATFSTPQDERNAKLEKFLIGFSVLATGGLLVASRKGLRNAAYRTRQKFVSSNDSQLAYRALNHALYADRSLTKQDIENIKHSTRTHPVSSEHVKKQWERFVASHDPKAVRQALKESGFGATDRRARRILRRSQKQFARQHASQR